MRGGSDYTVKLNVQEHERMIHDGQVFHIGEQRETSGLKRPPRSSSYLKTAVQANTQERERRSLTRIVFCKARAHSLGVLEELVGAVQDALLLSGAE